MTGNGLLTILGMLLSLVVVVTTGYAYLRKNTAEIAEKSITVWEKTAEGWQQRAEQLQAQNLEQAGRISSLETEVGTLKKLPDLTRIMEVATALLKGQDEHAALNADIAATATKSIIEAQEAHEERANERHEKEMEALSEIVAGLKHANGHA